MVTVVLSAHPFNEGDDDATRSEHGESDCEKCGHGYSLIVASGALGEVAYDVVMGWLDKQREKQAAKADDAFTQQLGEGEQIVETQLGVATTRNGDLYNGSMCLTNRRLIFIGKYATKMLVDEHPLDSTTGLTVATGKIIGTLGVKHGLKVEEYQCNAKALGAFVEKAKAQIVAGSPAPTPAGGSSVDELKKLAELHAQGILNDDEFASAKQRIIDSM